MKLGIQTILEINQTNPTQFASKIGVTRQTMTEWANGKSNIPANRVIQLSEFFNLPEEFFTKELTSLEVEQVRRARIDALAENLILPKNDGTKFIVDSVVRTIKESGGSIESKQFVKIFPEKFGNQDLDITSIYHKVVMPRYFGLVYFAKGIYSLTDLGEKYSVAKDRNEQIDIIFEALEKGNFGRNNNAVNSNSLVEPPLIVLKMAYDLKEISVTEFGVMLYYLHNLRLDYTTAYNKLLSEDLLDVKDDVIMAGYRKYFDPKIMKFFADMGILTKVESNKYSLSKYVLTKYELAIKNYSLSKYLSNSSITTPTSEQSDVLNNIVETLNVTPDKFGDVNVVSKEVDKSNTEQVKTSKNKGISKKSNLNKFTQDELNKLGWQGEACIYYNLINNNTDLLEKLCLVQNEDITDITWFNYGFDEAEDEWNDKSVGQGCDILVKTTLRTLHIEVKTSFSNTNFYSVTRNELRAMVEHQQDYFLIKINNFKMFNSTTKSRPTITVIQDPIQLLNDVNNIMDVTFFN